jgi:alpha-1,3-rhamnosyltransferase
MIEEKEMPLVSVVVPCYNHEKYVKETIESIINQTYKNIELIVIDDGSKDASVEVIKEMIPACEKRFTRFEFRNRPNKGLCATLNEALEWCEGKYFSGIASDDIIRTYKTEEQVKYLEKNQDTIGVFGAVKVLYKNGYEKEIIKKRNSYNFDDIFLHKHNLPAPTSLLRLENVKSVGGYRENFIIEDWAMWLDLTENGKSLDYLNRVFAVYRRHDGNLSGQFEKMYEGRMQIIELFKDKKNYKQAKSRALLVQANEVQTVNKLKSIKFALNSIRVYPWILFSVAFVKYIIKMFIKRKYKLN